MLNKPSRAGAGASQADDCTPRRATVSVPSDIPRSRSGAWGMIPLALIVGGVGVFIALSVADRPDMRNTAPIFAGLIAIAALAVVGYSIARIVDGRPAIAFTPDGFRIYALLFDNEPVRYDRITEIRRTRGRRASVVISLSAAPDGTATRTVILHRGFAATDLDILHALLTRLWKHSQ